MGKITVLQAAEKWNLTPHTVQDMCRRGRILGAEKYGRDWMIPDNAQRPVDKRTKAAKLIGTDVPKMWMPRQTPNLLMTDLYNTPGSVDECIEKLSDHPQAAAVFEASVLFARGEARRSAELILPLLDVTADFYGAIGIGHVLCACALWLNDSVLFQKGRIYVASIKCKDATEEEIRDFWCSVLDASVVDSKQFLSCYQNGSFDKFPDDSFPAVWFYYLRNLHYDAKRLLRGEIVITDVRGNGLFKTFLYAAEPLVTQVHRSRVVFAEICLRLLCADAYIVLNDMKNAICHLDAAIELALPDKLFGILAEFRGLFNSLMDERLELKDKGAVAAVKKLQKQMMENWAQMNDRPITGSLSTRENEVAQLIVVGFSNKQIAERLNISVNTVKSTVTSILNKTGKNKRSEITSNIL